MAVMIKKESASENGSSDAEKVLAKLQKDMGEYIGSKGVKVKDISRIPTGIFPLDLALGGGFPRGRLSIVWGSESCLAEDTRLNFATVDVNGKRQDQKGGTIGYLYRRFHGLPKKGKGFYPRKATLDSEFILPCMNDEGRVGTNYVVDVVDTGVQECFELVTTQGHRIEATANHKFYVGNVYVPLGSLKEGDTLYIHNNTHHKGRVAPRRNYADVFVKNHPIAPIKIVHDNTVNKDYVYKRLRKSRAVIEADMNALSYAAYIDRLNNNALEGLVFLPSEVHVHHMDENPENNELSNLGLVSSSYHGRLHALERHNNLRFVVIPDTVLSIKSVGLKQTYDVKMESPCNNFVAQKFVVHNSGKTALAYLLMAQVQREGKKAIYIDAEATLDPHWAAMFGIDVNKLFVITPAYAEQAVDAVEAMLYAKDVGIVVVDSVAALTTDNEIASSSEKMNVGGNAYLEGGVGLGCRRLDQASALNPAERGSAGWTAVLRYSTRVDVVLAARV